MKEPYINAPIIESVFEARFNQQHIFKDEMLSSFHRSIKDQYPKDQKVISTAFNIKLHPKEANKTKLTSTELKNLRYFSSDDKDVLHVTPESFAYSRLKPYISWDDAFPKFQFGFKKFNESFEEVSFNRMGLRYINRWVFAAEEIDDFLKIKPAIQSGEYPFLIGRTNQIFSVTNPTLGLSGEIKLQLMPKNSDKGVELETTYDIFVFKAISRVLSELELEQLYSNLRKFKNDLFESNIGSKSREMFK